MSEATVSHNAGVAGLLSDDRLTRRATGGDQRAFAAIYQRYHQKLYRYCLAIVGNPQDAQDALQNTMVKALRSLPGEERRIELKPWLYRVAHNESIELLRRRRGGEELDPETVARGPGLADEAATRERLRHLVADLGELPERQRGALVMRELAGLDFDEIGTALGTSPAVVRQTIYEARLGLREMDAGRAMTCSEVMRALSDGDGRVLRRRDIRAHLRGCPSCRRFREEIDDRGRDLAALSPLPAAAAAGLLQGVLGGSSSSGGGVFAALGAGAAKSAAGPAVLKSAAAVVAIAAVGVTAADRGGLIHLGADKQDGSRSTESGRASTTDPSVAPALPPGAGNAARAISKLRLAGRGGGQGGHAGSAKAGAEVGAVTDAGTGQHPESAGAPAPLPGRSAEAHTRGHGHSKEHPAASAHGQETAAAHKGAKGGGGTKSHPAHPSHPAEPAHPLPPVKPGTAKEPSPPAKGAEEKTPPGSGSATDTPLEGEAEASPQTGKGH